MKKIIGISLISILIFIVLFTIQTENKDDKPLNKAMMKDSELFENVLVNEMIDLIIN